MMSMKADARFRFCRLMFLRIPCIDDHMIFNIIIWHGDAAILNFSFGYSHPVIVHLFLGEFVILIQCLSCLPEHKLEFSQSSPPYTSITSLELGLPLVEKVD